MARLLFVRISGALGMMALAVFFVGLIPFLSVKPSVGAGFDAPAISVNREFKGDRLPLPSDSNAAVSRGELQPQRRIQARRVPVGCEPAFSPVSSPRLAYYFGRCTT
jgi:hypothetical protein